MGRNPVQTMGSKGFEPASAVTGRGSGTERQEVCRRGQGVGAVPGGTMSSTESTGIPRTSMIPS